MRLQHRTTAYAIALAALAAAVLLRWLLDPVLGDSFPLVTLFGAVAVAVWVAGYRAAVLVGILGYLACDYLFIAPRTTFDFASVRSVVGVAAYGLTCALVIGIGEAMRVARERAAERGELLRVTLSSIGDAVITTDNEGRVNYMNAVAESLTGWSLHEALDQPLESVFRIVDEDSREVPESPATKALREGTVVGLANHTILIAKDGVERPIDDSAAPIKDTRGGISGCVLIFRDDSAKRDSARNEASRLLADRRLASIVETSDDAIISKSLDGIIQSWNAAAERLFGFTAEQAVGRHISLVIPPERISEEDQIIASLRAGRRVDHFETERVRSNGARVLVSLTVSPIKDAEGKVVGASKIVRDVTLQRRSEERERRLLAEAAGANAKFRAFFDQGALFAGIMDVDGVLFDANRLSWEGCGYTLEQVLGKPFWEGPWWSPSPALAERIKAGCAEAAAGQAFRAELPYFVADGAERVVDVIILPIKDDAGRVLFLASIGTDITDRKQAEADRERFAADLSEVAHRKDEFLAVLSHELRNPLAPLRTMLEILKRRDREMVPQAIETMERQLAHLVRLIDDLLDINRINHNRIELRRDRIELASVIQQAVEATRPMTDSAYQTLRVVVPQEPIYLRADAVRLAQVFGNLLNNGSKYTEPGGTITVTVTWQAGEALVSVADTGKGIAADKLDTIFEMFTQVDRSLERAQGGLGLGLTLAKRLVEMHGGSVVARSAGEGHGSEFIVRLPIDVDIPSAAVPEPAAARPSTRVHRILIVDDNRDAASSLALLLKITGHESFAAYDGEAALEAVEKHRPEVVLLDIGMPKMSGFEVCRRIRAMEGGSEIVVIALTGWGQEEDRRKSREAGFDSHLVKPIDFGDLMKLLGTLAPAT